MSGGHWEYQGGATRQHLWGVAHDPAVRKWWRLMARVYQALTDWIAETEHAMDWDLSGDESIEDDDRFCRESFSDLLATLLLIAPDN